MQFRASVNRLVWLLIWALASLPGHADFRIAGVDKATRRALTDHLKVVDFPCNSPPASAQRIQNRADLELTRALQALGYFRAEYRSELTFDEKCWRLRYEITLGDSLIIREARIELQGAAAEESAFENLAKAAGLKPDTAFSTTRYEELKENIQARGLRQGYFDARFLEQRVDIYPASNVADITLAWDSGVRYRYGEITIDQSVLRPGLFQRLLSIAPGDPYDLVILQSDRVHLSDSRYFGSVELKPLLEQASDGQVPVHITATPGRRASYQVGAGYSTNTGARLRGDYTRHLINSRGHKGEISLLLSEVLTTVNLNYTIPWRDPRTDNLSSDLSYLDEENDSYTSERWEAVLTDNRLRKSGWRESRSISLSSENSVIADERSNTVLLMPGISWSRISADDLVYPSRGYGVALKLLASHDGLVSDSTFAQLEASAKWIRTLPFRLRLLLRATVGFTYVDSLDDLPASRRFFSGGDNSIRGYDYQSLGPMVDDQVVGGRHVTVASVEVERPVYKKWSVATFVDGGNAWDEGALDPVLGVGLGVRWRSPIGPLRVDVGVPLEDGHSGVRLHVSFGPEL